MYRPIEQVIYSTQRGMEEKLLIKVNVAERFYPLKIDRPDEARIREAAKMIDEKLTQYKARYRDSDAQDHLAMASLQFVIRLLDLQDKLEVSGLEDQLRQLESMVDDLLNAKFERSLT